MHLRLGKLRLVLVLCTLIPAVCVAWPYYTISPKIDYDPVSKTASLKNSGIP